MESPDGIFECKARGVFRSKGISPAVGDNVTVENGVISEIDGRKNFLIRPPLANLDQIIFIVSTVSPSPNFLILDKFIAIAEYKKIEPVVIITKTDLGDSTPVREIYNAVGIKVLEVNYDDESSIQAVRELLSGKISAFTGNSGAGKSTLLNAVDSSLDIPTGEISKKLGRGKHTTRHAELYKLAEGGYIADTPGFSTFETNRYDIIRKEELAGCFREFSGLTENCRFRDCSHTCEKGCAVIEAVECGDIPKQRHESYCAMYDEAKQLKEWELK
ncbi:MAG: ribosome small subunit-dependent GTPase A [Ruminococcus flavefaciens]|nr:ribosome small subunit-dependent GTPase A [Ruminococcus flavefaciens]MCM1229026.1 ribosome small subunit-dependent GTPase A [Ruminococcus flavefaciens]